MIGIDCSEMSRTSCNNLIKELTGTVCIRAWWKLTPYGGAGKQCLSNLNALERRKGKHCPATPWHLKFSAFIITGHFFIVFAWKACAGLKECVKYNSSYHQMKFNFAYWQPCYFSISHELCAGISKHLLLFFSLVGKMKQIHKDSSDKFLFLHKAPSVQCIPLLSPLFH